MIFYSKLPELSLLGTTRTFFFSVNITFFYSSLFGGLKIPADVSVSLTKRKQDNKGWSVFPWIPCSQSNRVTCQKLNCNKYILFILEEMKFAPPHTLQVKQRNREKAPRENL